MKNLFILFVVLNIVNVILQTVKSIATVKCGKYVASLVNAVAYGLYTLVLIYTNCDLNMWVKVGVVAISNLIGVFVVKLIEEKLRKDKLWKIELSVNEKFANAIEEYLIANELPYNYNVYGKHIMFSVYAENQKASSKVAELVKMYNGKYFVSENKSSLY